MYTKIDVATRSWMLFANIECWHTTLIFGGDCTPYIGELSITRMSNTDDLYRLVKLTCPFVRVVPSQVLCAEKVLSVSNDMHGSTTTREYIRRPVRLVRMDKSALRVDTSRQYWTTLKRRPCVGRPSGNVSRPSIDERSTDRRPTLVRPVPRCHVCRICAPRSPRGSLSALRLGHIRSHVFRFGTCHVMFWFEFIIKRNLAFRFANPKLTQIIKLSTSCLEITATSVLPWGKLNRHDLIAYSNPKRYQQRQPDVKVAGPSKNLIKLVFICKVL